MEGRKLADAHLRPHIDCFRDFAQSRQMEPPSNHDFTITALSQRRQKDAAEIRETQPAGGHQRVYSHWNHHLTFRGAKVKTVLTPPLSLLRGEGWWSVSKEVSWDMQKTLMADDPLSIPRLVSGHSPISFPFTQYLPTYRKVSLISFFQRVVGGLAERAPEGTPSSTSNMLVHVSTGVPPETCFHRFHEEQKPRNSTAAPENSVPTQRCRRISVVEWF